MNRYWDYTEQERAGLSHEDVEAFCKVELMEKGVANVSPLRLETVPEITVERKAWFGIEYEEGSYSNRQLNVVFETTAAAEAFIASQPRIVDSDWSIGNEYEYARHPDVMKIVPRQLCDHNVVLNVKGQLEDRKATKDRNQKASSEHSAAVKSINEALSGIWEDWRRCLDLKADAEEVDATLKEYTELCEGNEDQAAKFLAKAYDEDRLAAWREWTQPVGV